MSPSPWWHAPEAYLYAWDLANDGARFLPVTRDILAGSSFIDQRIRADLDTARSVSLAEIEQTPPPRNACAPAFIFHTAFCCSTLLARSLDHPGRTLVMREPPSLLQLAEMRRGPAEARQRGDALLEPTLRLLNRPFAAGERVLIKPTNLVNNLAPALAEARPGSRVLVLYDDLEAFLVSVLKRPRESERGIALFLQRLLRDEPAQRLPRGALEVTDLPRRAALAWALQMHALNDWFAGMGQPAGARARILQTPELLGRPRETLQASADWLDLGLPDDVLDEMARGPVWQENAKAPGQDYSPARRSQEGDMVKRMFGAEMLRARRWMAGMPGLEPGPLPASFRLVT